MPGEHVSISRTFAASDNKAKAEWVTVIQTHAKLNVGVVPAELKRSISNLKSIVNTGVTRMNNNVMSPMGLSTAEVPLTAVLVSYAKTEVCRKRNWRS